MMMMIDGRHASSESSSRLHAFDACTFSDFSKTKTFPIVVLIP